jgi:hypothetical protein
MEGERDYDLKLYKEAQELFYKAVQQDHDKLVLKRNKAVENRNS